MPWWTNLSAGQGSALAGLLTALGAVLGIVIAGKLFSGKVKTLKEALDESHVMLERHAETVGVTLQGISERIAILDVQASSLSSGVARIESSVGDVADSVDESAPNQVSTDEWPTLRSTWFGIRDELVRRASDDTIDGRTRAAYGRVDKRMIYELINKMRDRGDLSARDARAFDEAMQIWHRYKNRRKAVDGPDLARLSDLHQKLAIDLGGST